MCLGCTFESCGQEIALQTLPDLQPLAKPRFGDAGRTLHRLNFELREWRRLAVVATWLGLRSRHVGSANDQRSEPRAEKTGTESVLGKDAERTDAYIAGQAHETFTGAQLLGQRRANAWVADRPQRRVARPHQESPATVIAFPGAQAANHRQLVAQLCQLW